MMKSLNIRKTAAKPDEPSPDAPQSPSSRVRSPSFSTSSKNVFGRPRSNSVVSTGAESIASVDLDAPLPALPSKFAGGDGVRLTPEMHVQSPTDINPKKLNTLHKAVFSDDPKRIAKVLSDKKRDVNKVDSHHRFTALHVAAERGQLDVCKALFEGAKRPDTEAKDIDGRTPLVLAILRGHTDVVKFLVNNKADPNVLDEAGYSPLHYGVVAADSYGLDVLIRNGATKDVKDRVRHNICQAHYSHLM
ncbi:ankyrin repeat-containing domain protein [Phlyctochytrium arcticum]|nr:ankyrin repeat-containing domain protein [Phlyctochytrium arcticum]